MQGIIKDGYLLHSDLARVLYRASEHEPIIDYHCHIDPREIAENKQFRSITEAWLGGDHYKWRVLRANGVPEEAVTGDADDRTKFRHYAEVMPKLIGNPLYEWSHLELKRYFNYDGVLTPETADAVYDLCNEQLTDLRARDLIEMSGVEAIVTTDDPVDDLMWHRKIAEDSSFGTAVYPGWRPDKALGVERPDYRDYIRTLGEKADVTIRGYDDLLTALERRMDVFAELGCSSSDHGLEYIVDAPASKEAVERSLARVLSGATIDRGEADTIRYALLLDLAASYHRRGWVMQIHYGAYRNINSQKFREVGPDTGFDVMRGPSTAPPLARLLDAMNERGGLPKMVVYSLSPYDHEMIQTVLGAFQAPDIRSKMQLGAAWWYNDSYEGMRHQLTAYASSGVLGNFIGMLTDSRSFLSYTRHEYFRRLLADWLADLVIQGRYPMDLDRLEQIMKDIAVGNVRRFLSLPEPEV